MLLGFAIPLTPASSIPATNTSVNPARSPGPALVLFLNGQPEAPGQVWLFWAAPITGAIVGATLYALISAGRRD